MVDTMWVEKLPEPTELGTLGMKTGRLLTWIENSMISTPLILIDIRRELIINPRAAWSDAKKAAWKEASKKKTATWNRKKGQADAPA